MKAVTLAPLFAALAGAAVAAGPDDVATLNRTRTIVLEDVPACDASGAAPGAAADGSLRVGADALSLHVEFELGTARLSAQAAAQLERLSETLNDPALAGARFLIAGHTDARGSDALNVPLSCRRALAVRAFLQARGVDAERLQAEGFGARMPLAGAAPLDAANRRVEVRRLAPGPAAP